MISTRKAYGNAILKVAEIFPNLVILDAETSNSTFAETIKKTHPERFIECYIAEQNMISMATGLARMNKIPFCSTFAAFFARSFDQIRMAQYSESNLKLVGSHTGVSIGEDGSSQMGLEDIAIMRSIRTSNVLYPSDSVSTEKLVFEMARNTGIDYLRTTRADTEILYSEDEEFPIGGSKTLKSSENDQITILAAGITLHEALKAHQILQNQGINVRVIDLYSVKPIDSKALQQAIQQTKAIIVVEDHYAFGGLYGAVCENLANNKLSNYNPDWQGIHSLSVQKMPMSGKPQELLHYMQIDAESIVKKVLELV